MANSSYKLLDLLFNLHSGETFCVSPNKKGYHSIKFDDLKSNFTLISPPDAYNPAPITTDWQKIQLIAINPIVGFRRDECVTAYRSFLVELDDDSLQNQMKYVKDMGMPYSVCVFSGSKSLHFGIVLDEDLPDENTYRFYAEWILNIMSKADQKTKNPSRSIRCAGNIRVETGKEMQMLEIKERVLYYDLVAWLNNYPDKAPKIEQRVEGDFAFEINGIPKWIWNKLNYGIDESKGRNNEWFNIFMSFSKAGYSLESMIECLSGYFVPDRDFSRREWEGIAKKAFKKVNRQY